MLRLGDPDWCCADNLDHRGYNIASDKGSKDKARRDGSILAAVGGNESVQDGICGCGEEDWNEHDEEVLYDEVSYCMDLVLQHL